MKITSVRSIKELGKPKRIIIFLITFILTYAIIVTSVIPKKYKLAVGDIAKVNIKAPRDILDPAGTLKNVEEVKKNVKQTYVVNTEVERTALENINVLFSDISLVTESGAEETVKAVNLQNEFEIKLTDEQVKALLKLNKDEIEEYRKTIIETLTRLYEEFKIEDKQEHIIIAQTFIINEINKSKVPQVLKDLAVEIGKGEIRPNFYLDKELYEEEIKEKTKGVEVWIKKEQFIVEEGKPVTQNHIDILKELGLLNNYSSIKWYIYLSLAVLVLTALFLQWFFLYRYYREIFEDNGKLLLVSIINFISLILARTLSLISPFLIPLACAPMLLTLLIDYKVSVVLCVLNSILISAAVGFDAQMTLLALLNAVLGSILIKKMQARNDILYSAIFIAVINVVISLSIGIQLSSNITEVLTNSGLTSAGSIVSAVFTIGLLPFFESTFDIVTTIKLLELSNPNHTLLKKLLIEAPGSYHHSILVANLAEVAAEEVGGNPVLARVGAYYHDVGKIKRPYFFKENQVGNDNPHNKMTPNLSALVITSHVNDGLELAKKEKLPKVIRDMIEQHHGNTLVKYFYITAKNSSENPDEVKEEDFRYPGPIPQSKEAGIIMLADCIEAAVRSINEPSIEKIEQMVEQIVKDRLNEGQLDDCELTIRDLEKIKKAFLKSLKGIYHQRIEYPTDKWAIKNEAQ